MSTGKSKSGAHNRDIESGSCEERANTETFRHSKLYRAALSGDWKTADKIFEKHEHDITARISKNWDTALHIAAAAKRTDFVKRLVAKLDKEGLRKPNKSGNTAFCLAAVSGKVEIAQVMEEKDANVTEKSKNLVMTPGKDGMLPLYMAALFGHKKMVDFLYAKTDVKSLKADQRIELLIALISNSLFDVALDLFEEYKELATASDGTKETALHVLARMPLTNDNQQGSWKECFNICSTKRTVSGTNKKRSSKELKLVKFLWEQLIKSGELETSNDEENAESRESETSNDGEKAWRSIFAAKSGELEASNIKKMTQRSIFVAAKRGNIEFLKILLREYPDLIFEVDENQHSIFHLAVMHRQRDIFNLIHEIGSFKEMIGTMKDNEGCNILHLAGVLAPPERLHIVSGAALQLQLELLWFKEVEKIMHPLDAEAENIATQTPRALFSKNHKELKKQGQEWMKDTANYCMVVAALIAGVNFSAAFSVPGGTKETGTPNFIQNATFKIFVISDAISLILSCCSILTFLSILTSRYSEEDFLSRLPRKLVFGLGTLMLSIVGMMVVFCLVIFIVFKDGVLWVPILAAVLASIPVILFPGQQCRLFFDVVSSTYIIRSLFESHKPIVFCKDGKAMESKKEK